MLRLASPFPLLLLGCTRIEEDRALLLGAGTFAEAAAFAVGGALANGDDPATLAALSEPDEYDGSVPIVVSTLDREVERCDGCTAGAWRVTVSLAEVLFHGAPNAATLDEDFDCAGVGGTCDRDRGFTFDPADLVLTGTLVLEVETQFRDDGGRSVRSSVNLPIAAALTGEAIWIDRTAAVTLEATVDFDEYGVDVEVAGCVDGRRDHYDYYSTD